MRVLSAGGGSGGHVTPVLAVLDELKDQSPDIECVFVCDKSFEKQSMELMSGAKAPVEVKTITAGKLRRYHGIAWWRQLADVHTLALNFVDLFKISWGFFEGLWLIFRWRPDVVFTKGGFVCVPVGLAARIFRIPIVMHDSDTHPGLANRILARYAVAIATGSPLKYYNYPIKISQYVGIPINERFHPFNPDAVKQARTELGLVDIARPLVVVTGGGLGARRINQAMLLAADYLIDELGVSVIHITGQKDYQACEQKAPKSVHYQVLPFVNNQKMALALGSADVVVTRAGATTMLELAALKACVVIIPQPHLTGGHQLKNAKVYDDAEAAVVVQESELQEGDKLADVLTELINDPSKRQQLADNLSEFARPEAAKQVAEMILAAGKKS